MRIEKLKSGNYRIQPTINGKRVSITFDHKPTQKEINQEIYKIEDKGPKSTEKSTFKELAEKYIKMKDNVLSPATIRGYKSVLNNLPTEFLSLPFPLVTKQEVQTVINDKAAESSSKTVRNYNAFIMAVLKEYDEEINFKISLPAKKKPDDYIPSSEEVKKVLDVAKGTKWYIYFILGCYGMRRSEILPLTADDIHDDYIDINKTMVFSSDRTWITKELGKTSTSLRKVPVPKEIIALIRTQGIEISFYPDKILEHLHICQKKAGVPKFTFHRLRHYFCTELSDSGVSEENIMALGGWSTPHVMKSVYRHQKIRDNKKRQQEIAKGIMKKIL